MRVIGRYKTARSEEHFPRGAEPAFCHREKQSRQTYVSENVGVADGETRQVKHIESKVPLQNPKDHSMWIDTLTWRDIYILLA